MMLLSGNTVSSLAYKCERVNKRGTGANHKNIFLPVVSDFKVSGSIYQSTQTQFTSAPFRSI